MTSTLLTSKQKVDLIKNQLTQLDQEINLLESKNDLYVRSYDVIQQAKLYKIKKRKALITSFFNQAVDIVFPDEGYNLDVDIEEKDGKFKYNFVLYKYDKVIAKNNEVFKTTGGGIITVLSFVMKILFFINTNNKFYILDEVFSQISKEYRPNIVKLLRILSDSYGFTFLIISHENLEQEDVDQVFVTQPHLNNEGIPTLILNKAHQSERFDDLPKIKVSIENFQAIDKLDIEIGGITVIIGPSDSGKSAIQRAIRSVVVNDFDTNLYPRMTSKTRNKPKTKIRLEKDDEFIELTCSNKTVSYDTSKGRFTGKRLAEESINEILEQMGFVTPSKLILSKFSGDIKQQLSRIFITTQFDKLFYPEERTGIEKIFNLLFDMQLFTELQIDINKDILDVQRSLKQNYQQKDILHNELIKAIYELKQNQINTIDAVNNLIHQLEMYNKQIEQYNQLKQLYQDVINKHQLMYKLESLINNIEFRKNIHNELEKANLHKQIIEQLIQKYRILESVSQLECNLKRIAEIDSEIKKYLKIQDIYSTLIRKYTIVQIISMLNQNITKLNQLKIDINKYESVSNIYHKLVDKYSLLNKLEAVNRTIESLATLNSKINKGRKLHSIISKIIKNIELLQLIDMIYGQYSKYKSIQEQINQYKDDIDKLPSKYNIKVCSCCNGTGYVHL